MRVPGRATGGRLRCRCAWTGGAVSEIEIIDSEEDPFVGGEAMQELLDMVIEYNTTDIDAVSGATESSKGFLEAVESAIMRL
jgi:uncharacterized protein with FMN-binding domain